MESTVNTDPRATEKEPEIVDGPQQSEEGQTAWDFLRQQTQLEVEAAEVLPYKFDSCSQPLGPLRQTLFACTTCNPPPASPAQVYTPAGICYSCSISCHGDHTLVELFNRRNFVCDCGSTRIPSTSPCTLRKVHSQEPAKGNHYNHNFQNRFCGCREEYDVDTEKGTMFQCLGLGTVESGGCGEDWWHPECLMGLPRDWHKSVANSSPAKQDGNVDGAPEAAEDVDGPAGPPGFPEEDDFEALLCYKCVEANPWIKKYASGPGFLDPVFKKDEGVASGNKLAKLPSDGMDEEAVANVLHSKKRKASEETESRASSPSKRVKDDSTPEIQEQNNPKDQPAKTEPSPPQPRQKHDLLPRIPPSSSQTKFSLFLKDDFRDHLCHCPSCFPDLIPHPHLVEEEDSYQPPLSDCASNSRSASPNRSAGAGAGDQGSVGSGGNGSLLSRGEAALNNMDRVRAIEGVMAYNHLRDKVKGFLKPYAESGEVVGVEDIKAYFAKLRGDEAGMGEAASEVRAGNGADPDPDAGGQGSGQGWGQGGQRSEQSGY